MNIFILRILHPEGNKVKIGEDFDPRFPNMNNHLRCLNMINTIQVYTLHLSIFYLYYKYLYFNLIIQFRKCWDYYVTFHRCMKKYDGDAEAQKPCYYFYKLFNPPMCPPEKVLELIMICNLSSFSLIIAFSWWLFGLKSILFMTVYLSFFLT